MKRNICYLLAIVLTMALGVGLASCSKDDEDDKDAGIIVDVTVDNLVGTWQFLSEEDYDEDGHLEGNNPPFSPTYIHFDADGTATEYERDEDEWWISSSAFTLDGNKLSFAKGHYDVALLTTTRLVLKFTYPSGGWSIERYRKVSDSVITDAA